MSVLGWIGVWFLVSAIVSPFIGRFCALSNDEKD